MSFARAKRLLLGCLALVAPLPLPLNQVVGWTEVICFWLVVVLFMYRADRGHRDELPNWALNLLGLGYLPLLLLELRQVVSGPVLRPLAHLVLFTVAVKLFALKREKDKWHAFLGIFFLFLVAVGSSVHPAVVLYFVLFAMLALVTMIRFAGYQVLSEEATVAVRRARVPVGGFVTWSILLIILGAIPLFTLFPRIRQPYFLFSSFGQQGAQSQQSDDVSRMTLSQIGRAQTSQFVVLRYKFDTYAGDEKLLRFREETFELFRGMSWLNEPTKASVLGRKAGIFKIGEEASRLWISIWRRPNGSRNLILPLQTAQLEAPVRRLQQDDAGVAYFLSPPNGTVVYRAGLGQRDVMSRPGATPEQEVSPATLDLEGVTPRMEVLAAQVLGEGPVEERIRRLEMYFRNEYTYSLDLGDQVVHTTFDRFLFDTKRGYCEYFASAMTLLLRSQGIPARVAAGYLAGEKSGLGDYYIVRQSDGHAWVEAYVPEKGWTMFDPTPPALRGTVGQRGLWQLLTQAYDFVVFRWDRYVLTYNVMDQVGFLSKIREGWSALWDFLGGGEKRGQRDVPEFFKTRPDRPEEPDMPKQEREFKLTWQEVGPLSFVLVLLALWLVLRRSRMDATTAYRALRHQLERRDDPPINSTPPLEIQHRIEQRFPRAAPNSERVIELYLRESFGGETLTPPQMVEIKDQLRQAKRGFRKTA